MAPIGQLRRFLGLRQIDVEIATGVSVKRLSAAERGRLELSDAEKMLVVTYLNDRLRVARDLSVETPDSDRAGSHDGTTSLRRGAIDVPAVEASSIQHILHNERYRGTLIWGKTVKVRSQETGKRIKRRKPESEWRHTMVPEQRIVSAQLWNRVRERLEIIHKLYGSDGVGGRPRGGRAAGSPHLFTGLLECALCRGSITIVSGPWKKRGEARYGCSMHAYRGDKVCTNSLLIGRKSLEAQLLAGLQDKVLQPDVVAYTLSRFEEALAQTMSRQSGEAAISRRRIEQLEREIRNCTQAIASMGLSPFLQAQLTELETEHRELSEKLASLEPRALRSRLRDTRRFVETRLRSLQSMLTGEPRIARAEIAKHVQKIKLTPEGRTYIASGTWDLLGSVAVTMVPGGRVELPTPAFSGRRSTGELPRHTVYLV